MNLRLGKRDQVRNEQDLIGWGKHLISLYLAVAFLRLTGRAMFSFRIDDNRDRHDHSRYWHHDPGAR